MAGLHSIAEMDLPMLSVRLSVRSSQRASRTNACGTALMNLIETMGNLYYVYLQRNGEPTAPLVGFTAAALTLAKTVLYWAQEYYCDYCAIGHNSVDRLALWAVLNGCVVCIVNDDFR